MADKKSDLVTLVATHAVVYGADGKTVAPGGTFAVPAAEAEWLVAEGAAVKAKAEEL